MGQPAWVHPQASWNRKILGSDTQPTETSHVAGGTESERDSLSSGERTGNSLNAMCVKPERVAHRESWGFRGGKFGSLAELQIGL